LRRQQRRGRKIQGRCALHSEERRRERERRYRGRGVHASREPSGPEERENDHDQSDDDHRRSRTAGVREADGRREQDGQTDAVLAILVRPVGREDRRLT
jgi:hypothetical protein